MRLQVMAMAMAGALGAIQAQNTSEVDYQAPDFGKNLNSLCNKATAAAGDMQEFMQFVHKVFSLEHLRWGDINFQFPTDSYARRFYNPAHLKALRPLLFKDPKQVEAIFEQAMPAFQQQFGRMTENERADYLEFLRGGLDYAKNFDLAREKRDLHEIETLRNGSFVNEKGQLQAFIYRRIAGGDISQADCVRYLERAVQKFEATPQKDPENPLRNYVITRNYTHPDGASTVYFGKIYRNTQRHPSSPLFYRQDNQFLPFPNKATLFSAHAIGEEMLVVSYNEAQIYDIYLLPLAQNAPQPNAMPQPLFSGTKSIPRINKINPQLLSINTHTYIVADKNKPLEVHTIPPAQQNDFGLYIVRLKDGTPRLLSQSERLQRLVPNAQKIAMAPDNLDFWILQDATLCRTNLSGAFILADTLNLGYTPDSIRAVGSLLRVWHQQKMETIRHQGTRLQKLPTPQGANVANLGIKVHEYQTFITEDDRWGAYDTKSNQITIDPIYKSLRPDRDNRNFIAQNAQGKYGIIGFDGKIILDFNYTALEPVALEAEIGYIVSKNAPAHDLAALETYPENPNFGIINIEGTEIIPRKYYYIYYLTHTLSLVGQKDKKGVRYAIFNTEYYKFTSKFDYSATTRADSFHTIDPNTFNEIQVVMRYPQMPNVLVPNYDGTTEDAMRKYGAFLLRTDKSWQLIDFYGKKMNTPACDSLAFSTIAAHFEFYKGDKFGLIDAEGSIIIPAQYKHIYKIEETDLYFAAPQPEGPEAQYSLYNYSGKILNSLTFNGHLQELIVFDPETFMERVEMSYCPPAKCQYPNFKRFVLYHNQLAGLYDEQGQQILPHNYQAIQRLHDDTSLKALAVRQNDKWALFSPEGKPLTNFIYAKIAYSAPNTITASLPDGSTADLSDKIK